VSAHTPPQPVYPLREIPGDRRLTPTLVTDVRTALTGHGHPPLVTANNRLFQALYQESHHQ
jgi:hypothetical protein